jgi:hypothetical protein
LSARGVAALGSEFRENPAWGSESRRTKSRSDNPQKAAHGAAGRQPENPASRGNLEQSPQNPQRNSGNQPSRTWREENNPRKCSLLNYTKNMKMPFTKCAGCCII